MNREMSEAFARLRNDNRRLLSELDVAQLRAIVALEVGPLITDVVEALDGRALVVRDIVARWLSLSHDVRSAYGSPGIDQFGGDYVDDVDRAAFGGVDPYRMAPGIAERLSYQHWRDHVGQIRARTAADPTSCAESTTAGE